MHAVGVDHPLLFSPEGMRYADFRLEGPAIGTKVENLVGIVLPRWRRGHAHAHAGSRLAACEFLHAQGRVSPQQHGPFVPQATR
jgi:hypothetical protein